MVRLIEFGVTAVILFFAWQGAVSVDVFTSQTWERAILAQGGIWRGVFLLFESMQVLMFVSSALLIAQNFLPEDRQPKNAGFLLIILVLWAGLGWWSSRQISDGDPRLITHLGFSLSCLLSTLVLGWVVVKGFAQPNSRQNSSEE